MFSRDQLLAGMPAKRASTLLFAIEGEAARLLAASRINRAGFIGERTAAERERDFFKALSAGGALPKPPRIADLERFATDWASLVPEEATVRAALARLLGAKYLFRVDDVPRIRRTLGLDDPGVSEAFERLYQVPLSSIYVPELPLRARLGWGLSRVASRFDRLPAFWIAYFLAITEVLGEGILSLPLALAGLGPLPGVVILLVFGAINLITMTAMAESVIRNGSMRYGLSYIARLVTELLGRVPASVLGVVFAIDGVLTFWFYFLGFGSVLGGATGIPVSVWIALLFVVNVWVLRKETLDDTIASAVVIGTAAVLLLLAITGVALLHVQSANLASIPVGSSQLDIRAIGLIFGVVLMAFFGHTSAANSAKLLLTVEPSGRSLLWGNLAAMATVIVLYCVATFAIIGAVGAAPLLTTAGTAITPLADAAGPAVNVMGVIYVVLAIGIGSLYVTLATYNQVVELLPSGSGGVRGWLGKLSETRRGRLIAGFAPSLAVCVALEVAVLTGNDNFGDVVGFAGTLGVPVITGIFPMLLILAARRRGEYVPGVVIRAAGHPVTVAILVPLFILGTAAHALIWENPIERASAIFVAVVDVLVVAWAFRSGILTRRVIVEVRADERQDRATVSVVGDGRQIVPERVLGGLDVREAEVQVPAGPWRELRPWLHRVTADGQSVAIVGEMSLQGVGDQAAVATPGGGEPFVVPVDGGAMAIQVRLRPQ